MYCGTGCFHRRESLCGKVYSKEYRGEFETEAKKNADKTSNELEEASKVLANCSYEKDTQWGKKVSLSIYNHNLRVGLKFCECIYVWNF